MRRVIERAGTVPEGCTDPIAFLGAEAKAVRSEALGLMRGDPRWKILVSPTMDVSDATRTYRVHCVLDTEEGMMANPGGDA